MFRGVLFEVGWSIYKLLQVLLSSDLEAQNLEIQGNTDSTI